MSSAPHPGGARAPPGGRDGQRAAGPGSTQAVRLHYDGNATWALCHHLAAAAARAQSASCNNQSELAEFPQPETSRCDAVQEAVWRMEAHQCQEVKIRSYK